MVGFLLVLLLTKPKKDTLKKGTTSKWPFEGSTFYLRFDGSGALIETGVQV